jgi:hypothetical protein
MSPKPRIPGLKPRALGQQTLENLLNHFSIEQWDILLVGDGSGSFRLQPCGWGCVSLERATLERKLWYGACNAGTVNMAEMLAYLMPLTYFAANRVAANVYETSHVHIITDSAYLEKMSPGSQKRIGNANQGLLQIFRQFDQSGLELHWHWAERETVELNTIADILSKAARISLQNGDVPQVVNQKLSQQANAWYAANPNTHL